MTVDRRKVGKGHEERAARYLRRRGYRIVAANFQTRRGEIDLVAEKGEWIVFVEVRYRARPDFGSAAESVGSRKRRRLVLAASEYLARHGMTERPCRFDLIALSPGEGKNPVIVHLENAFDRDGRPTGSWSGGRGR
ncbi:MAG: YraN family protein [Candidatus Eisenbacteria bacterium]